MKTTTITQGKTNIPNILNTTYGCHHSDSMKTKKENRKTIVVSKEVWQYLTIAKIELSARNIKNMTYSETLRELLKRYEQREQERKDEKKRLK